jgi:hypothetical protein
MFKSSRSRTLERGVDLFLLQRLAKEIAVESVKSERKPRLGRGRGGLTETGFALHHAIPPPPPLAFNGKLEEGT